MSTGLSPKQVEANRLLGGPATHYLLYGGARSGKTYLFTRATAIRAMSVAETTHAIFRHHFNSLKTSIINDTFPSVMRNEFPEVKYELNKSDWFVKFGHNDSCIYYGGLDDKERTEKILGQGHSTIYLNEISQISYASALKATTRLSQNKGLRLRAYYDCNPPQQGHWSYKKFIKGLEPATGMLMSEANRAAFAYMRLNPADNPYLPEETLRILESLPPKERARFYLGEFLAAIDSALWTYDSVASSYLPDGYMLPVFERVVVAVDPSGCHGPEDKRSDEVGIVVVGKGVDGRCYILEDASGRMGPSGGEGWGAKVVEMYNKWRADCVVAESNFGGAMVGHVILTTNSLVPFREVHASRGKAVRAEPVSNLFTKNLVYLRCPMPELEEQLCNFATNGYVGERSPDRADAMIWGVSELMVSQNTAENWLAYYQGLSGDPAKAVEPVN